MKIGIVDSAEQFLTLGAVDITFVFNEVDPYRELSFHPFLYFYSRQELDEKIALLTRWPEIIEEIRNGMFRM